MCSYCVSPLITLPPQLSVIRKRHNQEINTEDSSPYIGLVKKGRGGVGVGEWGEKGGGGRVAAGPLASMLQAAMPERFHTGGSRTKRPGFPNHGDIETDTQTDGGIYPKNRDRVTGTVFTILLCTSRA